jgi:hypothetical protein
MTTTSVLVFFSGFYAGFAFFLGWYRIFERNKQKLSPQEFLDFSRRSFDLSPYEKDVVKKVVKMLSNGKTT